MGYAWLILALIGALFAGAVAIFGKVGLQGIDSNSATAIRAVIMAVFLIGFLIVQSLFFKEAGYEKVVEILHNHKALYYIALSGIAGAMSWLFFFLSLQMGKASQVAPIDRLSVVFVIIFSVLFLGESISLLTGIGTALIAIGAIFVALG